MLQYPVPELSINKYVPERSDLGNVEFNIFNQYIEMLVEVLLLFAL